MPRQRSYDHRLVRQVQATGDPTIATRLGVPRSTAYGWLRRAPRDVTTAPGVDATVAELQRQNAVLRARIARLQAVLRVLFVLFRVVHPDLSRLRVPASHKEQLLRAVERTRGVLGLRRVLAILGLSPARLHAWRVAAANCCLEDEPSCPRSSPQRATPTEISRVRQMVTADHFRHIPTGRLSVLAQRLDEVYLSTSTWYRLVRERGWRRIRFRVHPEAPEVGIRATAPNQVWHTDVTVIRLLDSTRIYVHAVMDNFSRRILAWHVAERLCGGGTTTVLLRAGRWLPPAQVPMLLVDDGVENMNRKVDQLVEDGLLRRVLAMVETQYSNSMIEAWWRALKHNWLYMHTLDTPETVRRLIAFYVREHNSVVPHAAFQGQTPDEMYFGTGAEVPERLARGKRMARERRYDENRAKSCGACLDWRAPAMARARPLLLPVLAGTPD